MSPHSYIVEHNDIGFKLHDNLFSKLNVQVDDVIVESIHAFDAPMEDISLVASEINGDLAKQVRPCI